MKYLLALVSIFICHSLAFASQPATPLRSDDARIMGYLLKNIEFGSLREMDLKESNQYSYVERTISGYAPAKNEVALEKLQMAREAPASRSSGADHDELEARGVNYIDKVEIDQAGNLRATAVSWFSPEHVPMRTTVSLKLVNRATGRIIAQRNETVYKATNFEVEVIAPPYHDNANVVAIALFVAFDVPGKPFSAYVMTMDLAATTSGLQFPAAYGGVEEQSLVLTSEGTLIPINSVNIGNRVRQGDGSDEMVKGVLYGLESQSLVYISTENGHRLELSDDYVVMTEHGMVEAQALRTGDVVITMSGKSRIVDIDSRKLNSPVVIYGLQIGDVSEGVYDSRTFFANGILVGDQVAQFHHHYSGARIDDQRSKREVRSLLTPEWCKEYSRSLKP